MDHVRWTSVNEAFREELEHAVQIADTPEQHLAATLKLSHRLCGNDNPASIELAADALRIATDAGDTGARGFAHRILAESAYYDGDMETALKHCLEGQEYSREAGDRGNLATYGMIRAIIYYSSGDLDSGLQMIEDQIEVFARNPPRTELEWEALGFAHSSKASIRQILNEPAAAVSDFAAAREAVLHIDRYTGLPLIDIALIQLHVDAGDYDGARVYLNHLIVDIETTGMQDTLIAARDLFRARIDYLQNGDPAYEDVLERLHQTLPMERMNPHGAIDARYQLLVGFIDTENYERALECAAILVEYSQSRNDRSFLPRIYEKKALAHHRLGQHEQESHSLREAIRFERDIGTEQANIRLERTRLTKEVEEQFKLTQLERQKNEELLEANTTINNLLLTILPASVATELKENGRSPARSYANVGILVGDVVGFSTTARSMSADALFANLNSVIDELDELAEECGVERLKTIGDAYLAVVGISDPVPRPAIPLAAFAVKALQRLGSTQDNPFATLRWGLSVGEVTAGIVGRTRYIFDIFGHTVNLAFRLQTAAEPGTLYVDRAVATSIGDAFTIAPVDSMDLKGVGQTSVCSVVARR